VSQGRRLCRLYGRAASRDADVKRQTSTGAMLLPQSLAHLILLRYIGLPADEFVPIRFAATRANTESTHANKKSELMLMRRVTQVILVYL